MSAINDVLRKLDKAYELAGELAAESKITRRHSAYAGAVMVLAAFTAVIVVCALVFSP